MWQTFGWSMTRYHQPLHALLDRPEAAEYARGVPEHLGHHPRDVEGGLFAGEAGVQGRNRAGRDRSEHNGPCRVLGETLDSTRDAALTTGGDEHERPRVARADVRGLQSSRRCLAHGSGADPIVERGEQGPTSSRLARQCT